MDEDEYKESSLIQKFFEDLQRLQDSLNIFDDTKIFNEQDQKSTRCDY